MLKTNKRILIVSHGHPDINKGGAEVAAYNMYQELQNRDEDVYFLARTGLTPHGGTAFSSRNNEREILFHTTHQDWFLFSNIKTRHMWQEFRDLLLLIKPEIVHLHHYFLLGIEMIEEIRQSLPDCKIILTLHEYLAICNHKGLMVKSNGRLCYKANARDCNTCLPEKEPGDYFLREKYIKRIFSRVNHFVSPSYFLKSRYVEWGLNSKNISVIENGQKEPELNDLLKIDIETKTRFSYFGQVNPYKGIDILIEAFCLLPDFIQNKVSIDIHGANLDNQSGEYKDKVQQLLKNAGSAVNFCGSYESHEMPKLLYNTDWVVVPSIWWENSPMVIQEAFNYRIPLIVSDIGGMAEKIKDGIDGLHFRTGKANDLADVMMQVVADKSIRKKLVDEIKPPLTISECVDKHINDAYI